MSNVENKTVEFSRAFFFPWVKGRISVDNRTVATRHVNTIGGIIPTGTNDQTIPLNGISSVSVGSKINIKSVLIGLLAFFAGIPAITNSFIGGLLLFAIGLGLILNGLITYITFNRSGSPYTLYAAFYCKKALEEIKPVIDQALVYAQSQTDLSALDKYFDPKKK